MLINLQYEKNDIVTFKLSNGDEVVARFDGEDEKNYIVEKPVVVIPSPQGIGLMQALFTGNVEKKISISKSHVMMHSTTVDKMCDHYIQTTTGIQPVTKGSVIV